MTREYTINQTKQVVKRVDPSMEYDIAKMLENKIFWWLTDFRSYVGVIMQDYKNDNLLKTDIKGEGRGIQYVIKGKNIINFIETYGDGIAFQSMRQKRKHGKQRTRSSARKS